MSLSEELKSEIIKKLKKKKKTGGEVNLGDNIYFYIYN